MYCDFVKYVLSISDTKFIDVIICYFIKHVFQERNQKGTWLQGSTMQSCRNCFVHVFHLPTSGKEIFAKMAAIIPPICILQAWLPATHSLSRRENMRWDMIPQFHMISLIVIIHLMCQYQAKQPAIWMSWSYSEYCEDQTKSFGRNNEEQMHPTKLFLILCKNSYKVV